MTEKANDVLEKAHSRNKQLQDYLRPAADFFHRNEGTMFGRNEAREKIGKGLDVDENTAGAVIAQLVSDKVDPIVQVATDDGKFVGVAEFHEFDGAYGYLEYDDAIGARRRVVCQQCVNNSDFDNEVTHATEQSPDPESSTFKQDVEYTDLVDKVHSHYQDSHESMPTEIATGATLASGTTIGGNTSFHAGNDGPGSGLDADTIDGQNRYQDSEARTAVSGSSIDGSNFTGVSAIEEVSTFDNLPSVDPPQLGYVIDEDEYYHSNLTFGSFDILNASFSTSINTQGDNPQEIAWNNDGSRLYELDDISEKIFESTVSTPFDITSASLSTSINTEDAFPRAITWNNDGTRLYEVGDDGNQIYQYSVSTPFDLATASFAFRVLATQDSRPTGIAWNNDGTRLYEVGQDQDKIYQSKVFNPFDIATTSFQTSINTQDTNPTGIAWNNDGTRLYEVGRSARDIYQYTVFHPFDIESASFSTSIDAQDSSPQGIAWNNDGSRLYEVGNGSDKIYQYTLSTGGWEEF